MEQYSSYINTQNMGDDNWWAYHCAKQVLYWQIDSMVIGDYNHACKKGIVWW